MIGRLGAQTRLPGGGGGMYQLPFVQVAVSSQDWMGLEPYSHARPSGMQGAPFDGAADGHGPPLLPLLLPPEEAPELEPELEPDVEPEPELEPDDEPELEPDVEPEPEPEPDDDPELEPDDDPELDPELDPEAEPLPSPLLLPLLEPPSFDPPPASERAAVDPPHPTQPASSAMVHALRMRQA